MILTVGNTKGGVGKSTLALQIALALTAKGKRVWLIDGDRQETCLSAITVRADNGRDAIAAAAYPDGYALRTQVKAQASHFDHVIIDAGGRDSTALRGGLLVSDVMLIPFLPRSFDVWALNDVAKVLSDVRVDNDELRAIAVLNAADPQGSDNDDASETIEDIPGIDLLPVRLSRRKAFAHASGAGLHIEEYKPKDVAAIEEMAALVSALFPDD